MHTSWKLIVSKDQNHWLLMAIFDVFLMYLRRVSAIKVSLRGVTEPRVQKELVFPRLQCHGCIFLGVSDFVAWLMFYFGLIFPQGFYISPW